MSLLYTVFNAINFLIQSRNPTPDGTNFQWTPLSSKAMKYLNINTALKMEDFPPFADRIKLWEGLFPVE